MNEFLTKKNVDQEIFQWRKLNLNRGNKWVNDQLIINSTGIFQYGILKNKYDHLPSRCVIFVNYF